MAIIISNVRAVVQRNSEFVRVQVPEKPELLDVLTTAHSVLLSQAHEVLAIVQQMLKIWLKAYRKTMA